LVQCVVAVVAAVVVVVVVVAAVAAAAMPHPLNGYSARILIAISGGSYQKIMSTLHHFFAMN
jgi:hypothetical protein